MMKNNEVKEDFVRGYSYGSNNDDVLSDMLFGHKIIEAGIDFDFGSSYFLLDNDDEIHFKVNNLSYIENQSIVDAQPVNSEIYGVAVNEDDVGNADVVAVFENGDSSMILDVVSSLENIVDDDLFDRGDYATGFNFTIS